MNLRHLQYPYNGVFINEMNIEYKRDLVSRFLVPLNSMKMGYFERVKFLKKANTLTLIPVRKIDFENNEEKRVTLLVPRFKNSRLKQFMLSGRRFPFIRIHLDEMGSKTWKLMDGETRVEELIDRMRSDEGNLTGELESRVSQFIFKLYQERYITFKEIE